MDRFLKTSVVLMTVVIFLGCGAAAREIQRKSESSRSDIFTEVREGDPIPKGFTGLTIKANIKTHIEGSYIGESKKSLHGKQGYPFLINIDGQAIIWKIDGSYDNKPAYDKDGGKSRDPEVGEGMKYVLEKKIRLPGGMHNVSFLLPEENYSAELKLTLEQGRECLLEFRPVYKKKKVTTGIAPSIRVISEHEVFLEGIAEYEAFLNGNPLKISDD